MNALGDTLFTADTVVTQKTLSRNSAKREIPLYRVGAGYGPLVGIAGDGERVYSLHKDKLVRTSFNAGVPISDVMDLKKSVSGAPAIKSVEAGPVVANSHLFFASDSGFWTVNLADDMSRSFTSTEGLHPQDLALCKVDKKDFYGVVVGEEGKIFMRKFTLENKPEVKPSFSNHKAGTAQVKAAKGEVFRVACTDLDRDYFLEELLPMVGDIDAAERLQVSNLAKVVNSLLHGHTSIGAVLPARAVSGMNSPASLLAISMMMAILKSCSSAIISFTRLTVLAFR